MTEGIPDPLVDFKSYQASLFKTLVSATAAVNSIQVEDIGYFQLLDRSFAKDLDQASSSTLNLGNNLLQKLASDGGIELKTEYEVLEDVVAGYGNVVDVCDNLLDKADICLDYLKGNIVTEDEVQAPEVAQFTKEEADYKLLHSVESFDLK
ncbi:unnamed protein product [Rhizopus stolonifer]